MNSAIANLINEVDDITDIYDMLSQKHKDKLVNIIVENNKKKINYLENVLVEMENEEEDENIDDDKPTTYYQHKKDKILKKMKYCDVCDEDIKYCSWFWHLKSKKHIKKMNEQTGLSTLLESYIDEDEDEDEDENINNPYYAKNRKALLTKVKCGVCNKYVGRTNFKRHTAGKKHQKMVLNIGKLEEEEEKNVGKLEEEKNVGKLEEEEEKNVEQSYYQKNKDRILSESIFCDVCNKDVKKIHFTRHCKTKRHLKNIIQE